jgi:hypothetical protein
MGFGMVIGFNGLLRNITTSNYVYNAIANSRSLQIITARTKSFSFYCIFTGYRLVTASIAVASSASVFASLLIGDCPITDWTLELSRLKQLGTDREENTSPNSSIVASRSCRTAA